MNQNQRTFISGLMMLVLVLVLVVGAAIQSNLRKVQSSEARPIDVRTQISQSSTELAGEAGSSTTGTTGVYRNTKYGYTLMLPPGWRLGTVMMRKLNERSGVIADGSANFREDTADVVVITTLTSEEETKRSRLLRPLTYYGDALSGNSILISAETLNFGLHFAQMIALANASGSNGNLPMITNVQSLEIASTNGAVRYKYRGLGQAATPIETVFIPYSGSKALLNSSGDLIKGVSVRSVHDELFDENLFETVYTSFRYPQ